MWMCVDGRVNGCGCLCVVAKNAQKISRIVTKNAQKSSVDVCMCVHVCVCMCMCVCVCVCKDP